MGTADAEGRVDVLIAAAGHAAHHSASVMCLRNLVSGPPGGGGGATDQITSLYVCVQSTGTPHGIAWSSPSCTSCRHRACRRRAIHAYYCRNLHGCCTTSRTSGLLVHTRGIERAAMMDCLQVRRVQDAVCHKPACSSRLDHCLPVESHMTPVEFSCNSTYSLELLPNLIMSCAAAKYIGCYTYNCIACSCTCNTDHMERSLC